MGRLTIQGLLSLYVFLVSLIVFPFLYVQISNAFNKILEKETLENAKTIADQTFSSMFQIMKKGWSRKDVIEFLNSLKNPQDNYEINIYRTAIVERLFGKIEQPPLDESIIRAIKEEKELILKENYKIRFIKPIKAESICLKCHTNAKIGDVLGVIEVNSDLSQKIALARNEFSKALLLAFPLPFVFIIIVGLFVSKKIKKSINILHSLTESISKIEDLEKLKKYNVEFPFEEFNEIYANLKELTDKVSKIAIDKDVLEFEIKLLEKFILTSETIKNWENDIISLLQEINKIIPVVAIFSVFKEDKGYKAEIFWIGIPSNDIKVSFERSLEDYVENIFKEKEEFTFKHNIARDDVCILNIDNTQYKTKTINIENLKIKGIVGLFVASEIIDSKSKLLVVESILSTLLNFVSSVKAIYKYMRELEYYATRDPLTDLYNQRIFKELFNYEVHRAKRHKYKFSLLVIDLDNFKVINDTYGHEFGDRFLVEFANILRKSVRPGDILARYGGDEFVIVLPETDENVAYEVAKRILNNVKNHAIKTPDGKIINPQVSIGISTYPIHADNTKDLFSIADTMMYKAKSAGKGQIRLPTNEDIQEFLRKEKHINIVLNESINEDKIIPYFQPIVDLKTDKVEGYEVLSRIEYNGEIIPANQFIETAEKTGAILKIDLIILQKVFNIAKNKDKKFFLNLSPKVLIIPDYLENVHKLIETNSINPQNIVFELTERDTVRNISMIEKFVEDLRKLGFKFAVDDFGSGPSSLYCVRNLSIDFIKIGSDFIKNIPKDDKYKAFVESIVILSKRLGIKTIGEGIENGKILKLVRELEIDYGQGFYLGKPKKEI